MKIHQYCPSLSTKDRVLPLYIATIGECDFQPTIHRPAGISDYQLVYTLRGTGIVRIKNQEYEVHEGDIFILPPFTPHEYRRKGQPWATHWITYNGDVTKTCLNFSADIKKCDGFEKQFQKIRRLSSRENWRKITSPLLYTLLLDISECDGFYTTEPPQTASDINAAVQYISEHYTETIELSRLARISGISEGHFCRAFKQHTHMRPIEYITHLRVEHAKDLLLSRSHFSITQIATKVGYADPTYFSKIFREKVGVSPDNYRKAWETSV